MNFDAIQQLTNFARALTLIDDVPMALAEQQRSFNVKLFGAVGDGVHDDGPFINDTIAQSKPGDIITFPAGVYITSVPILLKGNRTYRGSGKNTIIAQKENTPMASVIRFDPNEPVPRKNCIFEDFMVFGNAGAPPIKSSTGDVSGDVPEIPALNERYDGSGWENWNKNHGIELLALQDSTFHRVGVTHTGGTGIVLDGVGSEYHQTSATNHLNDCWVYGNWLFGVHFKPSTQDNHLFHSDIGWNHYENLYFQSGSCSVQNTAIWGGRTSNGIMIGASSNQLINNHIEGNAQHGIVIGAYGDHTMVIANKIYDNAFTPENYGKFDGIYVEGTVEQPVKNTMILSNSIYAGIQFFEGKPEGYYRRAITLGEHHINCEVTGNSVHHSDKNANFATEREDVFGITVGDTYNGMLISTTDTLPKKIISGEIVYDKPKGRHVTYADSQGKYMSYLQYERDAQGGQIWVDNNTETLAINIKGVRFDDLYTPTVTAGWDTTVWITDKTTTGFTVNFGTPPPWGGPLYWNLVSH